MKKVISDKPQAELSLTRSKRQVQQYDKILRENMEITLPGLIKKLFGIQAVQTEELPDDIQHTRERKPDVLKKIQDANGKTFILHVELQTTNEEEMVFRMAEYYIMLSRCYRLPVRQYVIYLGEGDPHMSNGFLSDVMHYVYRLVNLCTIDYRLFLNADKPEEKILALLANFGDDDPGLIIEDITKEVIATSEGDFAKLRHIEQLRILSNLRNFKRENIAIMESAVKWFKKERDFLYQEGIEKGIERGIERGREKGMEEGIEEGKKVMKLEFVKNLLLNTTFTIRKIASLADVSESFVRKIKKSLPS